MGNFMGVNEGSRCGCGMTHTAECEASWKRSYGLERVFIEGSKLHAFLSGGGLRVVQLSGTTEHPKGGYGEHPEFEVALTYAVEDFDAGGREYSEVYGKEKPHYLTGSSTPCSKLDGWVLAGQTIDAWNDPDKGILVELHGYARTKMPADVEDQVMKRGEPVEWALRGYTFRSERTTFPNGDPAISTKVLTRPESDEHESRAFHYPIVKRGKGSSFTRAAYAALEAEPEEE